MRLLADENISNLVINRLRSDGHDVESIAQSHSGIPDEQVLLIAQTSDRIPLTGDHDFGELVIRQRLAVRSLILLELDRLTAAAEAAKVSSVIAEFAERFVGHFVVIEPTRVRLRPLKGPTP